MFISKKKYKEKLDLIEGYREKNHIGQDKIYDLEIEISHLENKMDILENNNRALIENNNKLTDWIYKIINEIGCYEVPEYNSIRIPIYKNKIKSFGLKQGREFIEKEVILPEICLKRIQSSSKNNKVRSKE